jgi:hypothetical protein
MTSTVARTRSCHLLRVYTGEVDVGGNSATAISALMTWERIFRRSAEYVRPVRHFPYAAAG